VTVDLRLGDCLEILPTLEAGSVDAIVTDPPYFVPAVHYQTRKQFTRSLSDLGMLEHFFKDFFRECARVLKPTGVYYVFCDGQSYPVFYAMAYPHCRRIVPLVWDKQVSINGYSWRHQHELIMFGEMPKAPSVKTGDGDILKCRAVPIDQRDHPAQKPVELLKRLITKSVLEGGVVLDPFMGSAATGIACKETGRGFIGIEKDLRYYELAQRLIAEPQAQPALLVA
jgi:site-specific DNA-methyltransferase (adenine-specific)